MYKEIKSLPRVKEIIEVMEPLTILTEERIIEKIIETGALLEGHWELLSKKHSPIFLKFRLIEEKCNNGFFDSIAKELIEKFKGKDIDIVLGRETAGSLLVDKICSSKAIPGLEGTLIKVDEEGRPTSKILSGAKIKKGDKVLIVDDLTTTGTGLNKLISLVEKKKAKVEGIGLFATRNQEVIENLKRRTPRIPNIHVLVKVNAEIVERESCELCKKGEEIEYSKDHM